MPRVTFHPSGRAVSAPEDATLLDAAWLAGVSEVTCCGVTPACGKCRVTIVAGEDQLSPPDALEREKAARLRFLPGERFGCMARLAGPLDVECT